MLAAAPRGINFVFISKEELGTVFTPTGDIAVKWYFKPDTKARELKEILGKDWADTMEEYLTEYDPAKEMLWCFVHKTQSRASNSMAKSVITWEARGGLAIYIIK